MSFERFAQPFGSGGRWLPIGTFFLTKIRSTSHHLPVLAALEAPGETPPGRRGALKAPGDQILHVQPLDLGVVKLQEELQDVRLHFQKVSVSGWASAWTIVNLQ